MVSKYEELVRRHGYCQGLCGINTNGESVMVTIDKRKATIRTFQHNGYIRTNVYHEDGTYEELYSH